MDWKLSKKTEDAKFYYDKKDVTQSTQKTVKVWIKQVYMKRGKMDTVTLIGTRHEKLSYLIFTNGLLFLSMDMFWTSKIPPINGKSVSHKSHV